MKSLFVFSFVMSAAFACSAASADILTINADNGNTYEAELDMGESGVCDMDGRYGECDIINEDDDTESTLSAEFVDYGEIELSDSDGNSWILDIE
ncbi:MAG: hypothetical protein II152_09730 [Succinivibrionaceae bacterium]|nr:hypothetical protein [Succinivibrionaceae bacterium]